jgi:hypothetical protein
MCAVYDANGTMLTDAGNCADSTNAEAFLIRALRRTLSIYVFSCAGLDSGPYGADGVSDLLPALSGPAQPSRPVAILTLHSSHRMPAVRPAMAIHRRCACRNVAVCASVAERYDTHCALFAGVTTFTATYRYASSTRAPYLCTSGAS